MANGFIVIDDKTWEDASVEERERMTYNTLRSVDKRLSNLEKRPFVDKLASFAGGIVGGALAFCGLKIGT